MAPRPRAQQNRSTAPSAAKPARVSLNLNELEKEDPREPFVVLMGDPEQEVTFIDSRDLDWEVLETMAGPSDFMYNCLTGEDFEFVRSQHLPGWKINRLWEDYQAHFGLGSRGNGRGSRS